MGHQRLGTLPATKKWRDVVALLSGGADAVEIAAATAAAAETMLAAAGSDGALRHAFYLLARIPLAAREAEFGVALRRLGLNVDNTPTLVDVCAAMTEVIDQVTLQSDMPTDFSEMATLAAAESLMAVAGREGPSLFGASYAADETRAALRGLSTERQFSLLARDFFGRLTRRCLDYFLSRVIANHVGMGQRFPSIVDHHKFDAALELHCREASLIMEVYAGEWFSKTHYEGGITPENAGGFVDVAFDKVRKELLIRRSAKVPIHA